MNRREFLINSSVGCGLVLLPSTSIFSTEPPKYNDPWDYTDFFACAIIHNKDITRQNIYINGLDYQSSKCGYDSTFYYMVNPHKNHKTNKQYRTEDMFVLFNGQEHQCCVIANAIEGWIEHYKIQENGRIENELADWKELYNGHYYSVMQSKLYRKYGKVQILKR